MIFFCGYGLIPNVNSVHSVQHRTRLRYTLQTSRVPDSLWDRTIRVRYPNESIRRTVREQNHIHIRQRVKKCAMFQSSKVLKSKLKKHTRVKSKYFSEKSTNSTHKRRRYRFRPRSELDRILKSKIQMQILVFQILHISGCVTRIRNRQQITYVHAKNRLFNGTSKTTRRFLNFYLRVAQTLRLIRLYKAQKFWESLMVIFSTYPHSASIIFVRNIIQYSKSRCSVTKSGQSPESIQHLHHPSEILTSLKKTSIT